MIPKLGQNILRQTRGSLRPLVRSGSQYVKVVAPLTPALAVRSFSIQIAKQAEQASTKLKEKHHKQSKSLSDTLEEYKKVGNLKGAVRAVQKAKEAGLATPAIYLQLLNLLRDSPFDLEVSTPVIEWFYSGQLPVEILEDLNIWKSVLKLGFNFASTYRSEDLRALVERFTESFDLTQLNDEDSWELLIRAYGIMNNPNGVTACINKYQAEANSRPSFYTSALLAYADCQMHNKVEELLEEMKSKNLLSKKTLLRVIRSYGFLGDVERTTKYREMCNSLYPDTADNTMLLIAHKVALQKLCDNLVKSRGVRGLSLKPPQSDVLDNLHQSWSNLTKDLFKEGSKDVDIIDCNVVLEYLTIANRIDPVQFPIEKAEEIFSTYMPNRGIKPTEASHNIMLVGYAHTQQYNDPVRNVRLDKALEVVSRMQVEGIHTLTHPTFHALFRACIPHHNGNYCYDNFRLSSLLPSRPHTHNKFKVDSRLFEIEKIMLEARIPHDRYTLTSLMTSLAVGGQFKALQKRWNSIKLHGLRRDVGMYRLMFALASLNPQAAQRALVVVKSELEREVPKSSMNWETYTAMLDCCVISQSTSDAKEIIQEMRKQAKIGSVNAKKGKYPHLDEPNFYLPLLRAAVILPELDAKSIIQEIDSNNVIYSQGIWEAILSNEALNGNAEGIHQIFNKYTMSRFEKQGKIPVPVREASKPVVPFPTAPYDRLDMQFIDVYLGSLLDSENISLVMDVLRVLVSQTDKIGISRNSLLGIVRLAKQEKSLEDLKWFRQEVLPKITHQNKAVRLLMKQIDSYTK